LSKNKTQTLNIKTCINAFMPKLSKKETELIYLEIEKSRINREKSKAVLDKSFMLYFAFLVVGVIGFATNQITPIVLNVLVICGFFILVIGTIPYVIITTREDKFINEKIDKLKK